MDIHSCVKIVIVSHFGDIGDPCMSHLKAGNCDGHISGWGEVVSVFVLEVFILDVQHQLGIVGSKMADCKAVLSIEVLFYDVRVVGPGVADFANGS